MPEIGLERVLDGIERKIDSVANDLRHVDEKMDGFILNAVTKQEFDAYTELRLAIEKDSLRTRRSNVRWAVTTIISVLVLLVMAATYIVQTRPEIVIEPTTLGLIQCLVGGPSCA